MDHTEIGLRLTFNRDPITDCGKIPTRFRLVAKPPGDLRAKFSVVDKNLISFTIFASNAGREISGLAVLSEVIFKSTVPT
jgi:hypothetical protein